MWWKQLPFRGRKGNAEKTNPPVRSLVRFQCRKAENLLKSCTGRVPESKTKSKSWSVFLLDISRSACNKKKKNSITLTKVPRKGLRNHGRELARQ
jgi:hypothetical protein